MWNGRLGKIGATKHRIDLKPVASPIYQAPYQAGPTARAKKKTEVHCMLRAGAIEPATAELASRVVLVPKKVGSRRFCVKYGKLNEVTIWYSYPLLQLDECIDTIGDATLLTTLDFNNVYWQV